MVFPRLLSKCMTFLGLVLRSFWISKSVLWAPCSCYVISLWSYVMYFLKSAFTQLDKSSLSPGTIWWLCLYHYNFSQFFSLNAIWIEQKRIVSSSFFCLNFMYYLFSFSSGWGGYCLAENLCKSFQCLQNIDVLCWNKDSCWYWPSRIVGRDCPAV